MKTLDIFVIIYIFIGLVIVAYCNMDDKDHKGHIISLISFFWPIIFPVWITAFIALKIKKWILSPSDLCNYIPPRM